MNILQLIDSWLNTSDTRNSVEIENDINEEFQFHIESLVQEKIEQGLPEDDARTEALKQFGSADHYSNQCRHIYLGSRIIINRLMVAGVFFLVLLTGFLFFRIQELHDNQLTLQNRILKQDASLKKLAKDNKQLSKSISDKSKNGSLLKYDMVPISGIVTDQKGTPLEKVDLLIILKTWPDNKYLQQSFYVQSDKQGCFNIEKQIPRHGQFAINISAIKNGYGLQSAYLIDKNENPESLKELNFKLTPSRNFTIQVVGKDNHPIEGVRIYPAQRKTEEGEHYLVYHQASEPIQFVTDSNGEIPMNLFSNSEEIEFRIQFPGQQWSSLTINTPSDQDIIKLKINSTNNI